VKAFLHLSSHSSEASTPISFFFRFPMNDDSTARSTRSHQNPKTFLRHTCTISTSSSTTRNKPLSRNRARGACIVS
jgi:hypothetical protein